MHRLFGPYTISFIWLVPFFVLAFLTGRLYYQHWVEDNLNLNFKLNLVNLTVITIIAIRNLTLVAFYKRGPIGIFDNLWPFVFFFFLIILVTAAGINLGNSDTYYSLTFRHASATLIIILIALIITPLIIKSLDSFAPRISKYFLTKKTFKTKKSKSAADKSKRKLNNKLSKYSIPPQLYPPAIDGFIANPIQHFATNALTVWYQPDDPAIAEQSRGVTVVVTHQKNIQKADEFLKRPQDKAFSRDQGELIIGNQKMYRGFNPINTKINTKDKRKQQSPALLISWFNGPYTFEIYTSLENNVEDNDGLMLDLAKKVATVINEQAQNYLGNR
ncbi:MAG TPA: hypothetical protein ENH19_02545 [Actinobacteria bacterium]|nr:hypothetical protein [Actinomycetes bacterium]HEX21516.1 hypothetical protein [Actinomycetota bacterium]